MINPNQHFNQLLIFSLIKIFINNNHHDQQYLCGVLVSSAKDCLQTNRIRDPLIIYYMHLMNSMVFILSRSNNDAADDQRSLQSGYEGDDDEKKHESCRGLKLKKRVRFLPPIHIPCNTDDDTASSVMDTDRSSDVYRFTSSSAFRTLYPRIKLLSKFFFLFQNTALFDST